MNRFFKISFAVLSFAGSLALCSGIVAMQRPLPTAPAGEEQVQVITLPEVVIVGSAKRAQESKPATASMRSHRADRSAPTGSRPVRTFVHTLTQGGSPTAPAVLVTEF